jgi:hypothetical protein
MGVQFRITIKQHCMTDGCCDFAETVLGQQAIGGDEIPVLDIPIGCLKAPANVYVINAVGYYFGHLVGGQYVFDASSRKYLRIASDADRRKWEDVRKQYVASQQK